MDFSEFVGKFVKIEVLYDNYYMGLVLEADENSITIKDKRGSRVTLKEQFVLAVREVDEHGK